MNRRTFLQGLLAASVTAAPFGGRALAAPPRAKRFIVFYFPDGIAGTSASGEPSLWTPTGGETDFALSKQLEPLAAHRDRLIVTSGLSMGATDEGSHPGGAKKLLTARDGGGGESIDQYLARTVGKDAPFRHLYLGAAANANGASGDKHVSYVGAGTTATPDDDPAHAFSTLFGAPKGTTTDGTDQSILDVVMSDLDDMRAALGAVEKSKLDLHLEALRDLEKRIAGLGGATSASCTSPVVDVSGIDGKLADPGLFPKILRAQIDLMVLAMACDLSKVGVLQSSVHTSELIMSRFVGSEMYDPGFDMRSHQASHYGATHDFAHREFRDYVAQRRWWVSQMAYLLDRLKATPDGTGSMLDSTVVLLCTEIADGNTHLHGDMPFVLAGGAALRTGRFLRFGGRRHADLLLTIAQAMGDPATSFGEASAGPLPGVLST